MTPHGLVIGKFLPPHAGHDLLIRAAASASDHLTVVVLARSDDEIALADRVRWLAEVHADDAHIDVRGVVDDHPVDFADPHLWDLHERAIRSGPQPAHGPVTAVFSSEHYGTDLARRLDATHVLIDPERTLVPIAATDIRNDLVRHWEHLAAPVRRDLARRVVVIGAESTGKTTLSRALVDRLRARGGAHGLSQWVPEHGRDFTLDKLAAARATAGIQHRRSPEPDDLVWTSDEFVEIARRQNALEDQAAALGGPVLVCDTDAFATAIWHERYLGMPSAAVDALTRVHPLYLVTHHDDVPFAADGIRDGEHVRAWMTDRFLDALGDSGRHTVVLRGSHDQRIDAALVAIDALLARPTVGAV